MGIRGNIKLKVVIKIGIPVLILGQSGSGKSTSMRNFEPEEVGIFNVAAKPLPFRKRLNKLDGATYERIRKTLSAPKLKRYVIDDSQFLMVFASFEKAKETGYGKFTDMALDFYNLVQHVIYRTPPDVLVYFLHHTDTDDAGRVKAKTIGKMLDAQLTLEGLFSVVLLAGTDGQRYFFQTKNNGFNTVKAPMGMFETDEIDNDLKLVDTAIREYWGLTDKEEGEAK